MHALADKDFIDEFRLFRQEVRTDLKALSDRIGTTNDAGNGGTGLAGDLARTKTRLYSLVDLKNTGTGWLKGTAAVLAVTGALILLGAKAFIVELLSKAG